MADALIARRIEPHPRNRGKDEAVLKAAFISVWAIIGGLRTNGGEGRDTAHG